MSAASIVAASQSEYDLKRLIGVSHSHARELTQRFCFGEETPSESQPQDVMPELRENFGMPRKAAEA